MLLKIASYLLPWPLRRRALERWFGYKIHASARIGLAWVFPRKLVMEANTRIDHFTVAINVDYIEMNANATIGRNNWITGYPLDNQSRHFQHQRDRQAELRLGESVNINKNHHLDCTNCIEIGRFTTIAGYYSQFLTHSIDLVENRQDSAPITIGEYAFVGTNVVILGGSVLPSRSVLGAKSLLNKVHTEEQMLYAGVPAKALQEIASNTKYFSRTEGYVY